MAKTAALAPSTAVSATWAPSAAVGNSDALQSRGGDRQRGKLRRRLLAPQQPAERGALPRAARVRQRRLVLLRAAG